MEWLTVRFHVVKSSFYCTSTCSKTQQCKYLQHGWIQLISYYGVWTFCGHIRICVVKNWEPKQSWMTPNYRMIVERYPQVNGVGGGSIPSREIFPLLHLYLFHDPPMQIFTTWADPIDFILRNMDLLWSLFLIGHIRACVIYGKVCSQEVGTRNFEMTPNYQRIVERYSQANGVVGYLIPSREIFPLLHRKTYKATTGLLCSKKTKKKK